jgi:hypothetical protein
MPTYNITLTQDEVDMMEKLVPNVEEWVVNATEGKLNQTLKRLTHEYTNFNSSKLTKQEMIDELKKQNIPSRVDRDLASLPPPPSLIPLYREIRNKK